MSSTRTVICLLIELDLLQMDDEPIGAPLPYLSVEGT